MTEVYFDEYTSVILLSKSMIEVYFNHTTVTRSITEVYLLYTYPVLTLIRGHAKGFLNLK